MSCYGATFSAIICSHYLRHWVPDLWALNVEKCLEMIKTLQTCPFLSVNPTFSLIDLIVDIHASIHDGRSRFLHNGLPSTAVPFHPPPLGTKLALDLSSSDPDISSSQPTPQRQHQMQRRSTLEVVFARHLVIRPILPCHIVSSSSPNNPQSSHRAIFVRCSKP